MKPSTGIPVRIQKVGEAMLPCAHEKESTESKPKAAPASKPVAAADSTPVEPKVEIRELEAGVFEITVTCRCGERSVVRCESLVSEKDKKS